MRGTCSAASRIDALHALWADAGLVGIETREIVVQRTFESFDSFWAIARTGPRIAPALIGMADATVDVLKARLRQRLSADADGRMTFGARANAIKGLMP